MPAQYWYAVNLDKKQLFKVGEYSDAIACPIASTAVTLLTSDLESDGKGDGELDLSNWNFPSRNVPLPIKESIQSFASSWAGDSIKYIGTKNSGFDAVSSFEDISDKILPGSLAVCLLTDTLRNRISFTFEIREMVWKLMQQLGMSRQNYMQFVTNVEEVQCLKQRLEMEKRKNLDSS